MNVIDFRVRPRVAWYYKDLHPTPSPFFAQYLKLYGVTTSTPRMVPSPNLSDSIADMDAAGITKGVIFAGDAAGNEIVRDTVAQYPERYIGLAGVRSDAGVQEAYHDLKKAYLEYGMRGLNMSPYLTGVYATDARNYPLYQLSEELGRCVVIHTSAHYNPGKALDLSDPMQIDHLAVDFPKLKLVITHGGIGFGDLAPTIANRHENVFLDLTSLHPAALPPMVMKLANTQLKRKIIFGTNYPCLDFDIVELWKKYIKEDVQPLFFYGNAARALGID